MFLFLVYTCELKFLGFFDKELILLQSDQIQIKFRKKNMLLIGLMYSQIHIVLKYIRCFIKI